jgi:hypothetical protein
VASLRNSRIDIANDVFQCGAVVSGGQPSPFEQDILAPFFTASRMNFSLVQRPMDRPSGHRVVTLPEQSYSRGLHVGQKRSQGAERSLIRKLEVSRGHGKSLGRQVSHEEAESEEVSHRRSTGTDTGVTSASHTGRKSGNEYTSSNLISGPSKNPIIENKLTNTYRESADTGTSEEKSHTEREAVEDGESHSRNGLRSTGARKARPKGKPKNGLSVPNARRCSDRALRCGTTFCRSIGRSGIRRECSTSPMSRCGCSGRFSRFFGSGNF